MNLSKDAYFHNILCIRVHVPVVDFSCNMLFLVCGTRALQQNKIGLYKFP